MWGHFMKIFTLFFLSVIFNSALVVAGDQTGSQIKDFKGIDIRDRGIGTLALRGKIIILGFSNQETSDQLIEWQTLIGYETGINLGGYDDISILSIADVSRFPWIIRPIVRSRVREIYHKANQRLFQRFEANGTEPPPDLGDRLYLLPEWSGEILKEFGIDQEMHQPHLFIVDQQGVVAGHFTKNTGEQNGRILSLVEDLLSGQASRNHHKE
jgi:hypothetical protein